MGVLESAAMHPDKPLNEVRGKFNYLSENRIKILYKKVGPTTCFFFSPQAEFLGNSWKHGTLARMSTFVSTLVQCYLTLI